MRRPEVHRFRLHIRTRVAPQEFRLRWAKTTLVFRLGTRVLVCLSGLFHCCRRHVRCSFPVGTGHSARASGPSSADFATSAKGIQTASDIGQSRVPSEHECLSGCRDCFTAGSDTFAAPRGQGHSALAGARAPPISPARPRQTRATRIQTPLGKGHPRVPSRNTSTSPTVGRRRTIVAGTPLPDLGLRSNQIVEVSTRFVFRLGTPVHRCVSVLCCTDDANASATKKRCPEVPSWSPPFHAPGSGPPD